MGILGGLKHKHKIYNEDFTSRADFADWMDDRIDKLEDIRDNVKKCESSNWEMIENHQLADDLEDTIDEIIDALDSAIASLEDKKGKLKE